ncbi:translation initiation factor IF-2, partial [Leeuwenhoekiella sp. UBA1003]
MAEVKNMRLNKVLRELNISLDRAVDFLKEKGYDVEARPTTKISAEVYEVLSDQFQTDANKKVASKEAAQEKQKEKEAIRQAREEEIEEKRQDREPEKEVIRAKTNLQGPKQVGKIDLDRAGKPKEAPKEEKIEEKPVVEEAKPEPKVEEPVAKKEEPTKPVVETKEPAKVEKKEEKKQEDNSKKEAPKLGDDVVKTDYKKLDGPNFTGEKIDLSQFKKPEKKKKTTSSNDDRKRKRKRISKTTGANPNAGGNNNRGRNNQRGGSRRGGQVVKEEPTEEEVQKQIRETLEKLQGKSNKGKGAKYRRDKRDQHRQKNEDEMAQQEADNKVLKVTEFVTVSEVATMMDVSVTQIISACMSLGMMVTMNQRLDAETLSIVADEFGYEVEFVNADIEESIAVQEDAPEDLKARAPIVTVMGHVDHGKTSLLDYIREENVIAGESGGITQHIGAYGVTLKGGQKIAFLDTPGHEAFTAMRARGAQVTDIAIIVVAADDDVMPQTKEAISHAQAAGVPIIFAINKVDKPTANPEKIKEQLAGMNLLVEDWGGKIQSHDISAKTGQGVEELLEKVLLEAEILELKANPDKRANGTVVEAFLDRGRGYVSTVLVQAGTLKIGDYVLAGTNSGKIKAMHDERGKEIKEAGPATPVSILGLDGAPQAGDKFNVMEDEREAKDIANKRTQLQREQSVRTQKHITLDEIGRRIALGDFKELNIILKGDVDGSVEALTDSFGKLSTEEIVV